jgi:hypothetical protein
MEPGEKSVTFANDPVIIEFDRVSDEELLELWWTKEERERIKVEGKAERRMEKYPLFAEALTNYRNSVYRNTMRELRNDMANYKKMSETEKQEIREAFIDKINRLAYIETDYDDFYNSIFYAEYVKKQKEKLEKEGGKKSRKRLTTRKKRRRQKSTRRRGRK